MWVTPCLKYMHMEYTTHWVVFKLMRIEVNVVKCGNGVVAAVFFHSDAIIACGFGAVCVLRFVLPFMYNIIFFLSPWRVRTMVLNVRLHSKKIKLWFDIIIFAALQYNQLGEWRWNYVNTISVLLFKTTSIWLQK